MTTNVKGKTEATGAKGETKTTGLKEFLKNLATDARKLGEFLHKPEPAMSAANLSEEDKAALRSGVGWMVAARLAGVPLDQAFGYMIHPISAPQFVVQQQPPYYMIHGISVPQFVVQQQLPYYMIHPISVPQFVVQQQPPYYMIHPISAPQYVVQPPLYYPR